MALHKKDYLALATDAANAIADANTPDGVTPNLVAVEKITLKNFWKNSRFWLYVFGAASSAVVGDYQNALGSAAQILTAAM